MSHELNATIAYATPSDHLASDILKAEISGGVALLLAPFTTANFHRTLTPLLGVTNLTAVSAVTSTPANTEVRFILGLDGVDSWWDGAAWVVSDASVVQSNTLAEINVTAVLEAAVPTGETVLFEVIPILTSSDGVSTPTLTSITYTGHAAPASCDITGTILDACGAAAVGCEVTLRPIGASPGSAQAIGGVGILLDECGVVTDNNGTFTIAALWDFQYQLDIPDIGFSRPFSCPPGVYSVRFDLLGLNPFIQSALDFTDDTATEFIKLVITADSIGTVMERYETISIERAVLQAGPYAETHTIDLRANVVFYEEIVAGPSGEFFRVRYKHSNGDVSEYSDIILGADDTEALLISIGDLKDIYLFGTDLTDSDGTPFPDRMMSHYIKAASAWLAKELDIHLVAKNIVDELHDHMAWDYGHWGYFQLRQYPIARIDRVRFQYPSQNSSVDIDLEWVVLVEEGGPGVVQIVPGQGNIADVLLIPGQLMPLWSGATGRVPGVWRFSYRSGFEPCKEEEDGGLPADLKPAIGMAASIGVFNIAGDLIAGAGIANISIGIPGLNQSVGTTSSATNSGYGARIGEYQKELKQMMPNLRRFYGKGTRMVVA